MFFYLLKKKSKHYMTDRLRFNIILKGLSLSNMYDYL